MANEHIVRNGLIVFDGGLTVNSDRSGTLTTATLTGTGGNSTFTLDGQGTINTETSMVLQAGTGGSVTLESNGSAGVHTAIQMGVGTNDTLALRSVGTAGESIDLILNSSDASDALSLSYDAGGAANSSISVKSNGAGNPFAIVLESNDGTNTNTVTIDGETLDITGALTFDGAGVAISSILDEDNMASDSATALATQQSIKAYVDSQVASGASLQSAYSAFTGTPGTDPHILIDGTDGPLSIEAHTSGNVLEVWNNGLTTVNFSIGNTGAVTAASLQFPTGPTADTIETTLTNDDNHLPSSGAVFDAIAAVTLQDVYDQSSDPEIITSPSRNVVTIRVGSGSDTDRAFSVEDTTGGKDVFEVHGNGLVQLAYGAGNGTIDLDPSTATPSITIISGSATDDAQLVMGDTSLSGTIHFDGTDHRFEVDQNWLATSATDVTLGSATYSVGSLGTQGGLHVQKNLNVVGNTALTGTLQFYDAGSGVGATVDLIETAITDDDTHLPTSGAVVDYVAGFGFVDATGTPVDNQIAVFTDADTVEGNANFTFDAASNTLSGTALNVDVTGNFGFDGASLGSGAVNEITTTVNGSSTNNQLPTALAVYNALTGQDTFIELSDTPAAYTGRENEVLFINGNPDAVDSNDSFQYVVGTGLVVSNSTVSSSNTTGAVVVTGGVGIGGALNVGGAADLDSDLTVGGNVVVTGDLTVNGTTTTVDTETVLVEDNFMTLNNGEVGAGVTAGFAGLEIDRGTLTNYGIIFDETTDTVRIGEFDVKSAADTILEDNTQAVATREDAPTDDGVAVWNDTLKLFETDTNLRWDGTDLFINGAALVTMQSAENTDVDSAAAEDVDTFADTVADGAVWHYVIKSNAGTDFRAGTVTAVWNAANTDVRYDDVSTTDIGDTSGVTLSVDNPSSTVRLRATVTTDNWTVKVVRVLI